MLVDKLHTDSDVDDMDRQTKQLEAKNKRDSEILDGYFNQKQT